MVSRTEKKLLVVLRDWFAELSGPQVEPEKRVPSAYMFFCSERRAAVTEAMQKLLGENEKVRSADVTVKLSEIWKKLGDEDRSVFVAMAEKERASRLAAKAAPSDAEQKTQDTTTAI